MVLRIARHALLVGLIPSTIDHACRASSYTEPDGTDIKHPASCPVGESDVVHALWTSATSPGGTLNLHESMTILATSKTR